MSTSSPLHQKCRGEITKKISKFEKNFKLVLGPSKLDLGTDPQKLINDQDAFFKKIKELKEYAFTQIEALCELQTELDEIKALVDQVPQSHDEKDWITYVREYLSSLEESLEELQICEEQRFHVIVEDILCPA